MSVLSQEDRISVIRRLNDELRQNFAGGLVTITDGVAALSEDVRAEVLRRVRTFNRFTEL